MVVYNSLLITRLYLVTDRYFTVYPRRYWFIYDLFWGVYCSDLVLSIQCFDDYFGERVGWLIVSVLFNKNHKAGSNAQITPNPKDIHNCVSIVSIAWG